jgi:hypothetical protein
MTLQTSTCFVVMPFRPELNFLYLYLQGYLQEKHGLHVERGDHRILTKPLLEKIRDQILAADVIIGDITGRNPNVFYELGLADAYGKPVILLTQDPPTEAPADVRHLEYIVYDMAKHDELLKKIDNAIQNVFIERYSSFYERACDLLKSFNSDNHSSYSKATLEEFQARVMQGERIQGIPSEKENYDYAAFLLPRVLIQTADVEIMRRVTDWLALKFGDAR